MTQCSRQAITKMSRTKAHKERTTAPSETPRTQAESEPQKPALPPPTVRQSKDFISRYASSTIFDNNFWNARIVFGELMSEDGKPVIEQHTVVSMPWTQAKMLAAYLFMNIFGHEQRNGVVEMPETLLPDIPEARPGIPEDQLALAQMRVKQLRAMMGEKQK